MTDTERVEHIKEILTAWGNREITDFAALFAVAMTVRKREPVSAPTVKWALEQCDAHPEWDLL